VRLGYRVGERYKNCPQPVRFVSGNVLKDLVYWSCNVVDPDRFEIPDLIRINRGLVIIKVYIDFKVELKITDHF
jgi:hypothetical protein